MRPTSVLLCFGAMHIIAPSPTLSSEPVIGVPSAFDTNIYTRHKQARAHTHRGAHKHNPHPLCMRKSCRAFGSSRPARKTSLREGRRGMEEKRGGREEEMERGCFIYLK